MCLCPIDSVGWAMGIILVLSFACITCYSQWLVIAVGRAHASSTYGQVAMLSLGRCGLILSSIFMSLTCLIANASHMSVVSKMLHKPGKLTTCATKRFLADFMVYIATHIDG